MNPRFTFYKGRSPSASGKPGGWLIVLACLILLAAALFWRTKGVSFDWKRFVQTLYQVDWPWLVASILLMLLTYLLRALRWEVMLRPSAHTPGVRKLTYDTAIGFTASLLLGRVGEVVRPYLISISAGVSFSSQMAVWLLERILDLLSILLIFGFALLRTAPQRLTAGPELRWVLSFGGYLAGALGFVCLILLFVFRNFSDFAQHRVLSALGGISEEYYEKSRKLLQSLDRGLQSTREPRLMALLAGYTALLWSSIVASYYFLLHSFRVLEHLGLTDVIVILGFIGFGSIVQLPGVGGGMQVVCILCLTGLYGVPFDAASGIAVFIWLLTFLVVAPFGTLCAVHEGWNWRKIKQLATQPRPEEDLL